MHEYDSVEDLFVGEAFSSIHIECGHDVSDQVFNLVRKQHADKRCSFLLETDKGYERETIKAYLNLFARIAGNAQRVQDILQQFGLNAIAKKTIKTCNACEKKLVQFARISLADPEICFCEHPLGDLDSDAREKVLTWMGKRIDQGARFITTLEPLRDAMLMPGLAFWHEDGRFFVADVESDEESDEQAQRLSEEEVHVFKVTAKADTATLLFDPREVDFIESMNKINYVSVRGSLYQTNLTMDELERELVRFGFFRCHRSYIVNMQKIAKVERYTRNSFNLTLNDAARTSIPLAKGRAEEMRDRFGW